MNYKYAGPTPLAGDRSCSVFSTGVVAWRVFRSIAVFDLGSTTIHVFVPAFLSSSGLSVVRFHRNRHKSQSGYWSIAEQAVYDL